MSNDLDNRILPGAKTVYMIGIAGVGMTALAQVLKGWGKEVNGSDADNEFPTDAVLERVSIVRHRGFNVQNIPDVDCVITSSAYGANHVEVAEVLRRGLPLLRYDEALSQSSHGRRVIAVTGTHGKTTTTAMIGRVLEEAGLDPTVIVGASVLDWGSNARVGHGDWMVIEADEYQEKFMALEPEVLVITSIDWDHPDYFRDSESYRESFQRRVQTLLKSATVVGYGDDVDVLEVLHGATCSAITYGRRYHRDVRIIEESGSAQEQEFWIVEQGIGRRGPFRLLVPGVHMASNATAAIAVGELVGANLSAIRRALESFQGAERRMQEVGHMPNGATVVDDYAHHPVEVAASLAALRQRYTGKHLAVIFQAHTFTRTRSLLPEFSHAFGDADRVIITDIFGSARESAGTITAADLVDAIRKFHPAVEYIPFDQLVGVARVQAQPDDVWVLMGAGEGWKVARALVAMRSRASQSRGGSSEMALRNSRPDVTSGASRHAPTATIPSVPGLAQTVLAASQKNHLGPAQRLTSDVNSILDQLCARVGGEAVEENIPLSRYTTFRIGGPARWLVHARSADDIVGIAKFANNQQIPALMLSGGANMLVADQGFNGIVIKCEDRSLTINGTVVRAGSGVPLLYLATEAAKHGLAGAEFCAAIPGAVGGAIRGNAGAFGKEMKDIVASVEIWDGSARRALNSADCAFQYRTSIIKQQYQRRAGSAWIVLSAQFQFAAGDAQASQQMTKQYLQQKSSSQSLEKPSAGCIFKNVTITADFWDDPAHARWKDRVPATTLTTGILSAGWLIDHADLKGKTIGGAQVSSKHGNFIINTGSATAEDVVILISLIKQKVRVQFGIQLEEEVEIVGL
ncbi:UDP-N-acetylmuramate--L-alanine ligase [Candidatus Uhrbacteria bacterium]|nr:UDP-N-acetylmuramate--L-alanine ligase [Candidatus Uhrbacteria bacterium]